MENLTINKVMHLIEPLSFDFKLELLSKLTESLKRSQPKPESEKRKLLEELAGSWNDVDDNIIEDILDS